MEKKSTVAVVKVENDNIGESFSKLINLIGGMEAIIIPFQEVLIKPNLVTDAEYQSGAVTHPEVIKECVKHVLKSGAAKVIVGDSSFIGKNTELAIEKNNLRTMENSRVKVVDFKKSEYIPVAIPNALRYRRLSFPKEVMNAQIIINLPVMKTHDCLPVTLGLKNMKGVVNDKDKRKFHSWGLEEGIIDINKVVLADLTIIDGVIGMEGDGPQDGEPANAKMLIASFDALAAEVVAIQAMGFDHTSIKYVQMAYDAGFGEKDLSKINIVGDGLENVKKNFATKFYCEKSFNDEKIKVRDIHACSSCRVVINGYVKEEKNLNLDKTITLYAGDVNSNEINDDGIKIGIGNCLINNKELFNVHVHGCPPQRRHIKEAVKKIQNDIS